MKKITRPFRRSIMVKLASIFIIVIIVPTCVVTVMSMWVVFNRLEKDMETGSVQGLKKARMLLIEYIDRAENIAELLSGSERIMSGSGRMIQEILDRRKDLWFTAVIEVFDPEKKLKARSYVHEKSMESFITSPDDKLIEACLNLEKRSGFFVTPGGLAIKAAVPIVDLKTIEATGAIVVTFPFNIRFLRVMKEWVQAEITLKTLMNPEYPNEGYLLVTTISDEEGKPLSTAGMPLPEIDAPETVFTRKGPIGNHLFFTAGTMLKDRENRAAGILYASLNAAAIEETRQKTLRLFFTSLAVVFTMAWIIGILTARSFTRPIRRLAEAIHEMANGNLDERVHLPRQDEIGNLARDLNHMGHQLQRHINQTVEAKAASRAKSEFLANMSHEIRTPLNAVVGLTGLVLNTELTRKQKDYLKKISTSAGILSGIINDILDFSKIEAGKLELECVEFQLSEIMENLKEMFSAKTSEKGIDFLVMVENDIPDHLAGDALRLQQILMNLVSNAVKFTEKGCILVRVEKNGSAPTSEEELSLGFSVKDTGIGIPQDKMELLFHPFSQADGSMTRKYGGTGLGLHICKLLLEMMGGKITVESEPGRGSTFYFTLVLKKGAAESLSEAGEKDEPSCGSLDGVRVLLVEDNKINRLVAGEILKDAGMVVEMATDGKKAVEAVRKNFFDIILMDLQMPEMDGFTATKIIRGLSPESGGKGFGESFRRQNIPIVAITAHAMTEDRQRCLELGMDDYITKPIAPDKLYKVIRRLVSVSGEKPNGDYPINLESALKRINRNKTLLVKLFQMFSTHYQDYGKKINESLKENDMDSAIQMSHEIKGVAANLSAESLSRTAESLELFLKEGRENTDAYADELMEAFEREMKRVLDAVPFLIKELESDAPVGVEKS